MSHFGANAGGEYTNSVSAAISSADRRSPNAGICVASRPFAMTSTAACLRSRSRFEDPACYLDDEEIGVVPGRMRLATTPYRHRSVTA